MAIKTPCPSCRRDLVAHEAFAGKRGECPYCGKVMQIPPLPTVAAESPPPAADPGRSVPLEITDFLDPPVAPPKSAKPRTPISLRRMFEALLDPRSIQWMLTLGGGLAVLGVIVWLTSLGIFEKKLHVAIAMGLGSLALLGAGWWAVLKTRFRIAGQALTFLGCVVAPLNLWFYAHPPELVRVEDHLWFGGLICCLLYIATVYVLRDPLFVYAVEAGVTLTAMLFLAEFGKATDTTALAVTLMALGLASIHSERSFPDEAEHFNRRRFGLPFFWSGHAQVAAALLVLLGTQAFSWLIGVDSAHRFLKPIDWHGNWLTEHELLAGGLWLAGMYAYLYSDLAVRRIGVYTCLAAFCVVMAEITVASQWLPDEGWLAVLAVTALAVNLIHVFVEETNEKVRRVLPPVALALSVVPIAIGTVLHIRATSGVATWLGWQYETGWPFVLVMLLVAACHRVSAHLYRHAASGWSDAYFFGSAAALLVAAAGLLRVRGLETWSEQAPWLMLVPLAYLVAARLWRGHTAERPLGWVAHTAAAVILTHVLIACVRMGEDAFLPVEQSAENLVLGLVFGEAAVFYTLAAIFRRRSANIYFATAAACGAAWQFLVYWPVPAAYYTTLYAALGVAALVTCRVLGIEQVTVYDPLGKKSRGVRGRGLAAFQMGNAILIIALLAAFLQALNRMAVHVSDHRELAWQDLGALAFTTLAGLAAVCLAPRGVWRRLYVTATIALAAVAFLTLNILIDLSVWQKLEIFCVAAGLLLIGASYVGRFREEATGTNELISVGLWLGSILVTLPLVIAVIYYRFVDGNLSQADELVLLMATVMMLVTGYSWQIKSTTFFGGSALTLYLILVVVSLSDPWVKQLAVGVYLAVGGTLLFGAGIALSVYRDKLLQLPEKMAKREGLFRVLDWR